MCLDRYGTHTSLCSLSCYLSVGPVGSRSWRGNCWASHLASEVAEACSTDVQLLTSASSLLIGDKVLNHANQPKETFVTQKHYENTMK